MTTRPRIEPPGSGPGLHRVQGRHLTRSPAPGRVMRTVGMRREGTLRPSVLEQGRSEDVALHAALAGEWRPGSG